MKLINTIPFSFDFALFLKLRGLTTELIWYIMVLSKGIFLVKPTKLVVFKTYF